MKRILILICSFLFVVAAAVFAVHYKHKQEDAVAAYSLNEVENEVSKAHTACLKDCELSSTERDDAWKHELAACKTTFCVNMLSDRIKSNADRAFNEIDNCERVAAIDRNKARRLWVIKYPRQAKQKEQDVIDKARRNDAESMKDNKSPRS